MRQFSKGTVFFVAGVLVCGMLMFVMMPALMFQSHESRYDFQTTVSKLESHVKTLGWVHSGTTRFDKSIEKNGGGAIPPVAVLKVCHPDYAQRILSVERFRHLAALMPCSIAVYRKDSGAVYVAHFNTGLMGMMFGDPVRAVMTGPVRDFLADMTAVVAGASDAPDAPGASG